MHCARDTSKACPDAVKQFYTFYHDRITDKRYNSPYWIRRYAHRQIYAQFLSYLEPGQRVLDAGCGEGVLSCILAQRGLQVTGVDISAPNIQNARRLAEEWGVRVEFLQADVANLPFSDNSFEVVLSSHVLEHLPDMNKGLRELHRVACSLALIAMPTCLNPACWVLLGGDNYWKLGRRSLVAMPIGLIKTVVALVRGEEGPNEGYGGNKDVPHIWRFPWVMRRQIESVGFRIERFEAGPLILPYVAQYIPLLRRILSAIDLYRGSPILREFGYGSMAVCRKCPIE